ncbi:MAG: hypothetical protein AAB250_03735, partial [Bdellovibrionota bacterium]
MIKNAKGFSILETMIAVGLVGLVGLALTSLLTEMAKQQKSANVRALLSSQKLHIEMLIKDQTAWGNTLNGVVAGASNTEFACMRLPTFPCNAGTVAAIALYEATTGAGEVFFNERAAINGFTSRGTLCSTYPDNACPIRWDFTVTLTCTGGALNCVDPTIRVQAIPVIPQAQQEAMSMTMNPANYSVDVTRGVGTRFDPILVTEYLPGAGAGPCTLGNVERRLNREVQDPGGNVQVNLAGPGQVEFLPGSYQCRNTAPAFKVNTQYIELVRVTSGTAV